MVRKVNRLSTAAVAVGIALLAATVSARLQYLSRIPNSGNVRVGGSLISSIGHTNGFGTGPLTPFGAAFRDAGYAWTTALCQADSDGDNFTNGQELGDPDCDWTPTNTGGLDRTTDISHPGVTASVPTGPVTAAPSNSTPAPTTPAPTVAPPAHLNDTGVGAQKAATTGAFRLIGGATASFRVLARDASAGQRNVGDILEITMTTPDKSKFVAIGTSDKQMTGLLLVCFVAVDTTGLGSCEVWRGSGLSIVKITSNAPLVHVQSAQTVGAGYQIVARLAVADFGVQSKRQRAITAVGPYDVGTRTPGQHSSGDRTNFEANFLTGEVKLPKTRAFMWIAIGIDIAVGIIYCLVATLIHRCTRLMVRPLAWTIMNVVTMGVLVVMCVIVGVGRGLDAEADLQTTPWGRGAGAAAVAAGVITLFPTPKLLNPGWLFGATYERLIPFHRVTAVTLTVAATVHFAWMTIDFLPSSSEVFKHTGYDNSPLMGFLAWLCFTILTVTSIFGLPRRYFFWVWRLIHCLFVPGYAFAILHYPLIILGLAIPLILYVCDIVARMLAVALTGAKVKSVQVFEEAEMVQLDVELTGPFAPSEVSPGDFVHIGLMNMSNFALHPFTIAWYDVDTKVATFYIKALSSSWTGKLLQYAKDKPEDLPGTRVTWIGPYGTLQVPLGRVPNTVLVSGGIGVTPMLSALQYLASEQAKDGMGNVCRGPKVGGGERVEKCLFVWAARGTEIIEAFRPRIEEAAKAANAEVMIFNTKGGKSAEDHHELSEPAQKGSTVSLKAGRPDVAKLIEEHFAEDAQVAIYACGPAPMMDTCYDVASARPATFLHRETFEM